MTKPKNVVPLNNLRIVPPAPFALDGAYEGRWSGYTVRFKVGGTEYELDAEIGVRGLNIPCVVVFESGEARLER